MKYKCQKPLTILAAITAWLIVAAAPARADITDPATLHVGPGAGTACATGSCPLLSGELNSIGSGDTIDVYQNSSGAATLNQPLLLILAVPNNTTNLFSSNPINNVTYYNPYPDTYPGSGTAGTSSFATAGTYGLKANVSDGFFGSMTDSDIYTFLTLQQPADNSNSFTNLASYDASINGITATSFGMYVFAIDGGSLGANGLVDISFDSGAIPIGTYAVAYGFTGTINPPDGKVYDTPFTQAGLVTDGGPGTHNEGVPEPGALSLVALALAGIGARSRRRGAWPSGASV